MSNLSSADRVKLIHDDLQIDILVNMDGYSNNGAISSRNSVECVFFFFLCLRSER